MVSSPSGAGKTSICRAVLAQDRNVAYSVSATTRPRRSREVNGRSYHFLSEPEFRRRLEQGELLEHARVYDHYYGTPRDNVLASFRRGKDVIADLDIQGMRSCKQKLPGTVAVFIVTPGLDELSQRLRRRGTESTEAIRRRQAEIQAELAAIPEFDYLVVNDRLGRAVEDVLSIIRAERLKTARRRSAVGPEQSRSPEPGKRKGPSGRTRDFPQKETDR